MPPKQVSRSSDPHDSKAQALLESPAAALATLHHIVQSATLDSEAEMLVAALPGLMELAGEDLLAQLADGYLRLFRSLIEPNHAESALRRLVETLEKAEAELLEFQADALRLYGLCLQAILASTIPAAVDLLPALRTLDLAGAPAQFNDLTRGIASLIPACEALHAYERVESASDRMSYLAGALERLGETSRLARTFDAIGRAVILPVAEAWMGVAARTIGDLQSSARIACHLVTQRAWQSDPVRLALHIHNAGQVAALNLRIKLSDSPEYTPVDGAARIERLAVGDEAQVELTLKPKMTSQANRFRARFSILFDDPRGADQGEQFADAVHLLPSGGAFEFIPNPYVVGTPLQSGSPLFFGREDVFAFIDENLRAEHHNNVTLIGERRTGKSSLLKQLPRRLGDEFAPAYVDGQALAIDSGLSAFFFNVACEIAYALEDRKIAFAMPEWVEFEQNPARVFEHSFLPRVREAIGERRLLLLLDEFEELEAMVALGKLDAAVFPFLRHMIQHVDRLCVIFCGTHRMEELSSTLWQPLFNLTLYRHVGFLTHTDAISLIQAPVTDHGMRFDDLALDKLWRVTAGHPYFLQLLCHTLVNLHNRAKRSDITISDVNTVIEEVVTSSEAHFAFLWAESTRIEQLVLAALSRMITLTGRAIVAQIDDYLASRGVSIERGALFLALQHLAAREILVAQPQADMDSSGDAYSWRLGLLAIWVEKYRSIARILEEAAS